MTLRDAFRLQRAAKCERRGRGRNAARSRLAKGIFSFLTKPDERAKRALLERRSFARKLARKNPFLTPGANAPLMRPRPLRYYRGQSLRASRRNTSLRSVFHKLCIEAQPSPRTGKGDREAVEEVHGRTGKNKTQLQVLTSVVAPRMGAKRGMPVASPEKVARRAERGPWARGRAYFDLHGNSKLL